MVQASSSKNLWVAASDGDLVRVQSLISSGVHGPNDRDANSYTPMHAAASYAHLELLEYLISVGGDVNIPDDDGDSPLFTVESIDAARWLVEHGANPRHKNEEGLTPAEALEEDHPEVAAFLLSLTSDGVVAASIEAPPAVSQLAVDEYASRQTADLLAQTQEIMEQAERDGVDPEARLREVVERAVRDGLSFGGGLGDGSGASIDGDDYKRARGE